MGYNLQPKPSLIGRLIVEDNARRIAFSNNITMLSIHENSIFGTRASESKELLYWICLSMGVLGIMVAYPGFSAHLQE